MLALSPAHPIPLPLTCPLPLTPTPTPTSPQVGSKLDILNVMSYDASNAFSTTEAYDAYRSLFSGTILMGVEVPQEAWGGHVITVAEAQSTAAYLRAHGGDGMMIWSLQKSGTPSASTLSQTICTSFGLSGCSTPLP